MIITIDGPSGTGKSTVASIVATHLGMVYFDTGAMYRSFAWALLDQNIDPKDEKKIEEFLPQFVFTIEQKENQLHYRVGGVDVTDAIRSIQVTSIVSIASALVPVRKLLGKIQKEYAEKKGGVFDGRDMGSVIFPNAQVKIFLKASSKVRAKRRLLELREKHPSDAKLFNQKSMEQELLRRDQLDTSRKASPLRCPKGALVIDTTSLSIDQVVEKVLKEHKKYLKKLVPSWRFDKKMGFLYRLVLCVFWGLFRLFYRHKVYGIEHFVEQKSIIAPNHTSFLDPPIAAVSWPRQVHFLARESLFKPFLFGSFIRALNSHPVSGDPSDVSVFKTLITLLKEGKQILLFPEGGRTDGEIGQMKPGIAMLAIRSGCAIVPTYIDGAFEILPRHKKWPKIKGRTACVFGRPIWADEYAHLEKRQMQEAIGNQIHTSICALKDWYQSGAKGSPP